MGSLHQGAFLPTFTFPRPFSCHEGVVKYVSPFWFSWCLLLGWKLVEGGTRAVGPAYPPVACSPTS